MQDNVDSKLKAVQEEMNSMEKRWQQELAEIQGKGTEVKKSIGENQGLAKMGSPRRDLKVDIIATIVESSDTWQGLADSQRKSSRAHHFGLQKI